MQRGFLNRPKPKKDTVANKYVKAVQKQSGRNVQGTLYIGPKQIDNDNASNYKSIHSKQTKIQSKQKMSMWQKRFYLNQILQFIFDVADRNQVYRANFIHAHIPFAIIFKILDIETHTSHHTYLKEVINVLITKIKRQNLKAQLEKQSHFQQFMVVVSNPQPNEEELLSFLRKFIVENKQTMQGFLPYYYNYFALVVNKQIVFNRKGGELIEYTIEYKHKQPFKQVFSEKDISDILEEFEKKLVQKYHSDDI